MAAVKLQEWQLDWAPKIKKILKKNNGYIDTSAMRSGKTFVTIWVAQQLKLKLLVVCPITTMYVWKETAEKYGVEVVDTISYQSLRSTTDHQPKHNFLDRIDTIGGVPSSPARSPPGSPRNSSSPARSPEQGGMNKKTEFIPTQFCLDLLADGILLVFDEFQNIKNNSSQYKAASALIHALNDVGGRSRFALLSGTPFDDEKHAVNLLKMIGYIKSRNLYRLTRKFDLSEDGGKLNKNTSEIIFEGMQDLIDECMKISVRKTKKVLKEFPPSKNGFSYLCYKLYTDVIKDEISGAMSAPIIKSDFDVRNGFFSINKEDAVELATGIASLRKAVSFNKTSKTVDITADNFGRITVALKKIENAKARDMARVTNKALLASKKNLKVVISVNYTSTIEIIYELLSKWNPLILNGEVKGSAKRGAIIKSFDEDPEHRVIIMNTTVGGVGISLYSKESNQDRLMLISPNYRMIEVIQAASRIYGPGMKSKAEVRMFYGKCDDCDEKGVLNALAKKTIILKGILEDSVVNNLKLPGDYKSITEK